MNSYLVTAEVHDGEHAHFARCLIKANSYEEALAWASAECEKEENRFTYGDGLVATSLDGVQEVKPNELQVIKRLGIAYFVTEEV